MSDSKKPKGKVSKIANMFERKISTEKIATTSVIKKASEVLKLNQNNKNELDQCRINKLQISQYLSSLTSKYTILNL